MTGFYVTLRRGQRTAYLAGPFATHEGALARVAEANALACSIDPWAHFDPFGTARLVADPLPAGVLNSRLGIAITLNNCLNPVDFISTR